MAYCTKYLCVCEHEASTVSAEYDKTVCVSKVSKNNARGEVTALCQLYVYVMHSSSENWQLLFRYRT